MMFIITLIIIFTIFMVLHFLSENYRVNKSLKVLSQYENQILISNSTFSDKGRLCDYQVMSSFRPYTCIRQKYDYVSLELLKAQMRFGSRFFWLDVFCEDLSAKPEPVIFNGRATGNYNYSLNKITFEDVIREIGLGAFTSGKVNNYFDPFIIGLNLNVRKNVHCLARIKEILVEHCGNRLLDIEYSVRNTNKDISKIVLKDISGPKAKFIILASRESEGSPLEELVNGYWDDAIGKETNVQAISYEAIDDQNYVDVIKQNTEQLRQYNKTQLTIVYPETDTIFTQQYDPQFGLDYGCQFVCVNSLDVNDYMKTYIKKFNSNAFVLKDNVVYDEPGKKSNNTIPPKDGGGTQNTTPSPAIQCPMGNVTESDTDTDYDSAWDAAIF